MSAVAPSSARRPAAPGPGAGRILPRARARFFAQGYAAFTMDDLAADLGMSKKTLYVHFRGKDRLLRAVIDGLGREIRAEADALLADRRLGFAAKLHRFAAAMMRRLAEMNPRTLRDLPRLAPDLHRRILAMRARNIPYVFGRFIDQGRRTGMVRADVDTAFAVAFFLQAMQGLLEPGVLARLGLPPREVPPRAIQLLFGGLLTPAGRKAHEKLFAR
jgi:AcrR family transcriptional regulator